MRLEEFFFFFPLLERREKLKSPSSRFSIEL